MKQQSGYSYLGFVSEVMDLFLLFYNFFHYKGLLLRIVPSAHGAGLTIRMLFAFVGMAYLLTIIF